MLRVLMQRRLCHIARGGSLLVHKDVVRLVEEDVLPGTKVDASAFWAGLQRVEESLLDENDALLQTRDKMQAAIDEYHHQRRGKAWDAAGYEEFLKGLGYLQPLPEPGTVAVATKNVDPEIAVAAAPQLVCPVDNARYIINAANARWGSLLDALYASDIVSHPAPHEDGSYNPDRGAQATARMCVMLDEIFPLADHKSWANVTEVRFDPSSKKMTPELKHPESLIGHGEDGSSVLLQHHGLHIELYRRRNPGVLDAKVESAVSVIADAEDSACAVDAADKCVVYGNWTGLMKGTLEVKMPGGTMRRLNPVRSWKSVADGSPLTIPGRAVLLCRNVGPFMYTDIVKMAAQPDRKTPEQFLDAMITVAAAMHDLGTGRNSRTGSVYIVKPKMHGPDEVRMTVKMFDLVEEALGLPRNTVKIGIMDEERRTSLNLLQCLHEAKDRVFFINTGFLDRTGDEIHTSMHLGPVIPKESMRATQWIKAYEASNVDAGLSTRLVCCGQIGKGMWAAPDNLAEMMEKKDGHLKAGASTSWVPSPTAATLHALHYHYVDVVAAQQNLFGACKDLSEHRKDLLVPPVWPEGFSLSEEEVQKELDCNAQSLLGYVVRWVGLGVGCSKVPDTNNVQLMEDRATLRISSQHIANWLHHKIVTKEQVHDTLKRMAVFVDSQNEGQTHPMAPSFDSPEFKAACDLIFQGVQTPNGYTEDILSHYRRERKALDQASSA